jgi:hypothetical protein
VRETTEKNEGEKKEEKRRERSFLPSLLTEKPNLESWKDWAEIVLMENFYRVFNDQMQRATVLPTDLESIVAATLRFPHFLCKRVNGARERERERETTERQGDRR